jgi:hypothetical protein
MDGTNRRILAQDNLGLPNGLTFDAFSSQLCWVDAGDRKLDTALEEFFILVRRRQTTNLGSDLPSCLGFV